MSAFRSIRSSRIKNRYRQGDIKPRYWVLLALAGTAAFLWNQATRIDEPLPSTDVHVVTGTVDSFRTIQGSDRKGGTVAQDLVELREHPRVEFTVRELPDTELTPGTPVLFEMREDPGSRLQSASSGNTLERITPDGFVVDGTVVYSPGEAQKRRNAAISRYRSISLVLWAVVAVWTALLAWRHRAFLRSLLEPDGASAAFDKLADRVRRYVESRRG